MCSNKLFKFVILIIIITSFVVFSGCGGITTPETPSDSLNAMITATPISGEAPLEVTFDASESSVAQGNEIASYEWDFGDGKTREGGTIHHGFDSPGNYTVILTISDNKGAVDTSSVIIKVFQPTETVMEQNFNAQDGTEFDTGTGLKIIIPPALIEGQMNLEVKYNSNPSQSASDLIKLHSNYSITITPQKGFQEKELMTSGMTKYQETTQISLIFDVPEDVDPQSLAIFEWAKEGWCLAGAGDTETIGQLGGILSLDDKYISIEVPVGNSLSTPAVANINMFGIGDFVDNVLDSLLKVCPIITPGSELEFINGGDYIEKDIYFQSYSCEVFGSGQGIPYKVGILNNSNNLIVNDDYQPDWNQSYSGPYQILGSFELSDQSIGYLMPSDDENEKGVLTLRFGSEGGECTVWLEADGVMLLEMWLLSLIPGVEISATLADIFEMYIRNAGNYLMGDSVDTIKLFVETKKILEELTAELLKEGISHIEYGSSEIPVGQALTFGFKIGNLMKSVATYLYITSSSQNPCDYKSPGYWEKKIEVEPVNQLPIVSVTSPTEGSTYTEGETIIFEGKATDPEDGALTGDLLFWSLPSGKIIGTGESFSKNDLTVGTYVITLNAVDSQSSRGEYSVTITVTTAGKPDLRVAAVSLSNSSAQVGDTISVTFTVENKGGPVLGEFQNKVFLSTTQYGGEGQKIPLEDFPMFLGDVSSKTETVKIIVPQVPAGDWYVAVWTDATEEIQEANDDNNIDSAPISISTNYPPIITSTPVTSATVGQAYSYDVNATDADSDTRTYSLAATKPSGMIINSSTGLITWTPTAIGDYNVTVKVSDGIITVTQSFTITVTSITPETYTITASAGSHGSISPSGNVTVNQGSDKSFTITPDSGYSIDDVLVDGSSVGAVSSYIFSNVNENHTISATFKSSDIISASIDSYSPSSKITINTGQSFTISTNFTNTGNTSAYFYPGVSIWNSNGSLIFTDWGGKTYLSKGQQGSASWSPTISTPGEYWLQFGIWNEAKSELLDKEPSPSQNLIKVVEPPTTLSFTNLTPSQISTSTAPYDAMLSASGKNFNNVNRVSFSWSGAVSGSATWNKGDTNWNAAVTVNSDLSMTLQPRVVETNPTWSGTVYWTVTLRDNTGATASRSFTVTYTPTTISASIDSYSPSSKITVNTGQSFIINTSFTNRGNTAAYFYPGVSIWNSNGSLIFTDWGGKTYLNIGQQGSASWSHTINTPGEYWLQFGVWNEAKSELLDKKPSPSQNLIKVDSVTQLAPQVTGVDPSQPTANPLRQYIDILGNNFASNAQVTLQINSSVYPIPDDRTQFINSARIEIYVGLTDFGNWKVWITNPDGQKSNEYIFYVKP